MKKHLLGLTIFSLILASFAFAFAFFYTPLIPHIAEVETAEILPVVKNLNVEINSAPTSCWLETKKQNDISFEIITTQFNEDKQELISQFKLRWKGDDKPPKLVYATMGVFLLSSDGEKILSDVTVLNEPFKNGLEKQFTMKLNQNFGFGFSDNLKNNFYAVYNFQAENSLKSNTKNQFDLSEAKQVLFVHDNDSFIKK
jgi:hypothetical protein